MPIAISAQRGRQRRGDDSLLLRHALARRGTIVDGPANANDRGLIQVKRFRRTAEQTLWKIRYLGARLLMMRNRTDGLAQPPLIFSKSAMLRVSS